MAAETSEGLRLRVNSPWAGDRGYERGGHPSPPDRSRAPHTSGMLAGLEIQRVLPKRSRGPREALVWGWPTPIRMNARTELPPLPRKPVYGPAAREEARRFMREAKRQKINFGWPTKRSLCKVAKGDRPLGYAVWKATEEYLARKRREREVAARPLQLKFGPRGPSLAWRSGGPL